MSYARPESSRRQRIVLWGTCDVGKPRVRILLQGLRAQGTEVIECRADLWKGIEDKSQVRGPIAWLRLGLRALWIYPALLWRYVRLPNHDWVLLGYPAIPDIFVIRLFAWLRGTRVAMDWFLSAYDTIVLDRALFAPGHPMAIAAKSVEWFGVRLADVVFMDTATHARRMEKLFGLASGRCGYVWVGVEDSVFITSKLQAPVATMRDTRVLFYGQFIPLHGLPTIVEAARLLRDAPIDWQLIGRGQEDVKVRAMLDADPLPRMHWLDWVPYADLPGYIQEADICLGIFGTSNKAGSVIPNKVFQILAAGRPLVTRDSEAMHELLDGMDSTIALVPAGNAHALANAIDAWRRQPPHSFDRSALFRRICPTSIGRQLLALLAGSR